jgi:hypothetical protein
MSDTTPIFESISTKLMLATVTILSVTSLALNFVVIQDVDSLTGVTAALSVQDVKVQTTQSQIIDDISVIKTRVSGTASR